MLYFVILSTIFAVWGIYCNERTYKDREQIRNKISKHLNLQERLILWIRFSNIEYDDHFFALLRLKSPDYLYTDLYKDIKV